MPKFPVIIKVGSVSLKITPYDNHGYKHFLIVWNAHGKRERESRSTFQSAKLRAQEIAIAIGNGQVAALTLSGADRDSYVHACRALQPLGLPLHAAIEEFVAARQLVQGSSLIEVAREYASRHNNSVRPGKVPDLVTLCLQRKAQDGLSKKYLTQLKSDLNRLANCFQTPIASVTTSQLEDWLRSFDVKSRTRDNLRTSVQTFFSFCKESGYLPAQIETAADTLKKIKVATKEVEIFTPEVMEKLLHAATPEMIPYLCLGGFAGLRSNEIERLDWSAIHLEGRSEPIIEVKVSVAKTGSRRMVPISENLRSWLAPLQKTGGPVTKPESYKKVTSLASELGIKWPQNVLRHSAISYRVALTNNIDQIALESGNSAGIIHQHYKQLTTQAEAKKWFGIFPKMNKL